MVYSAPSALHLFEANLYASVPSLYDIGMRSLTLVVALLLSAQVGSARADVKETVDIATVRFPDGWQRTAKERTYVSYATVDAAAGSFCQLYAMVSAPSTGTLDGDFDTEWKASAIDNYGIRSATPLEARSIKGWSAKAARGTLVHNGRTVTMSVYVYSNNSKRLAYLTVTNDPKRYARAISTFLASIALPTTTTAPPPTIDSSTTTTTPTGPATPTTNLSADLTGAWGFSTGGAMGTGQYAPWLSDRREYTFDGKGTYTFLRRHNVDRDPDTSIVRERGTYTLTGDVLTLTPTKSEREIWSKVMTGPSSGAYAKLLRREALTKEKATYRVAFTFYPNTKVPNLMLTPSQATQRDGNFNATTQYRLFRPDGSYYTSIPPTP